jgi:ribosomal protein S18 acetylase RimI-like enzyme
MRETITFRPETDEDLEFLCRLYISTREDEMKMVDWPDEQKLAFLVQQFQAQRSHYRANYDQAEYLVILENGVAIGRLYLHRRPDDLRVMDIALMPEHRKRGIGGMLMQELIDQAREKGVGVSIHVEFNNPAMHLYERLGFQTKDTSGVYHLMEWHPGDTSSGDAQPVATLS